jgi:hypothetical protein
MNSYKNSNENLSLFREKEFFTRRDTIIFTRGSLLHGVSYELLKLLIISSEHSGNNTAEETQP